VYREPSENLSNISSARTRPIVFIIRAPEAVEVSDAVPRKRGEQGVLASEVGVDGMFVGIGRAAIRFSTVHQRLCSKPEVNEGGLQQAPPRVCGPRACPGQYQHMVADKEPPPMLG